MRASGADAGSDTAANVLAHSARALLAVVDDGRSADDALARVGGAAAQRSAVRAITLGSIRWYLRLDAIAALLLAGKRLSPPLHALLVAALHQLEYSRNAPAALVSSAVDAVRVLREPRAAAMMNALLRRFGREREALLERASRNPVSDSAHPTWLIQALRHAWPEQWQHVLAANNAHPPMTLRLDTNRSSQPQYLQMLAAAGMAAQPLPWLASAMVLERPVAVTQLPGFAEGLVSVQDAGAQLAAALLQVRAGERVLDACAAPGGKTGALLESVDGALDLTALDIEPARLQRVADNLQRLRRQAALVCADLAADAGDWSAAPYDRILLDAPCSGTGVIRRHPDIKLLRRASDIDSMAQTQAQLLRRCLGLLRPGGQLLYTTCSVLPAENEQVVESVLNSMRGVRAFEWPAAAPQPPGLVPRSIGAQLLPGNAALADGFYYACLTVT